MLLIYGVNSCFSSWTSWKDQIYSVDSIWVQFSHCLWSTNTPRGCWVRIVDRGTHMSHPWTLMACPLNCTLEGSTYTLTISLSPSLSPSLSLLLHMCMYLYIFNAYISIIVCILLIYIWVCTGSLVHITQQCRHLTYQRKSVFIFVYKLLLDTYMIYLCR